MALQHSKWPMDFTTGLLVSMVIMAAIYLVGCVRKRGRRAELRRTTPPPSAERGREGAISAYFIDSNAYAYVTLPVCQVLTISESLSRSYHEPESTKPEAEMPLANRGNAYASMGSPFSNTNEYVGTDVSQKRVTMV